MLGLELQESNGWRYCAHALQQATGLRHRRSMTDKGLGYRSNSSVILNELHLS